jgi:hypothetical protein
MKKLFIFFLPLFLIMFTGCNDKTKKEYVPLIPKELNSLLIMNEINPDNYNIDMNENEYDNKNIKKSIVKIIETNHKEYSNYLKNYLNQNSFSERSLMRAITNYLENKKIDGIIPLYNSTENEYTVTLRLTGENNIFAKIAKWVNNIFINFSYLIIAIIDIFLFFILFFLFLFSRLKNNIVYFLLEFIISIALISITIFQYYFYNSVLYKLLEDLAIMIGLELFL